MGDSQTGEQLYHRSPSTGVRVLSPTSGLPSWGSDNGRRNYQRIRLWSLPGFDYRTSTGRGETETPFLEGTHKVVCAPGPTGKEQWPHRRLKQTYLLVLEGFLQKQGLAMAHHGDKDTGSRSSGKYSLGWALLEVPLVPPKGLWAPVLGCLMPNTNREGTQLHPSADKQIKVLLSSDHHQSLPSGSLHTPLR